MGKMFVQHHNLQLSDHYRKHLASLPHEKYMLGNRDGVGVSANTHRVQLKKELARVDEQEALKSGQAGRSFWGLIHHSFVSGKEMHIVLLDEPV